MDGEGGSGGLLPKDPMRDSLLSAEYYPEGSRPQTPVKGFDFVSNGDPCWPPVLPQEESFEGVGRSIEVCGPDSLPVSPIPESSQELEYDDDPEQFEFISPELQGCPLYPSGALLNGNLFDDDADGSQTYRNLLQTVSVGLFFRTRQSRQYPPLKMKKKMKNVYFQTHMSFYIIAIFIKSFK